MCKQIFHYFQCGHGASAAEVLCEHALGIDSPFWMVHACQDYERVPGSALPTFCGGPGWYCGQTEAGKILDSHHETILKANGVLNEARSRLDELVYKGRRAAFLAGVNTDTGLLWSTYELKTYKVQREMFINAMMAKQDALAILKDGAEYLAFRAQHQPVAAYELPNRFIHGPTKLCEPMPLPAQPTELNAAEKLALWQHMYTTRPYVALNSGPVVPSAPMGPQAPGMVFQPPQTAFQTPQTALQPPQTAFQPPQTAFQPPQTAFQPPQFASRPPRFALQPPNFAFQPSRPLREADVAPNQRGKTSSPSMQTSAMQPPPLKRPVSHHDLNFGLGNAAHQSPVHSEQAARKKQKKTPSKPESVRRSERVRNKIDYAESERSMSSHGTPSPQKSDTLSPWKSDTSDDVFGPPLKPSRPFQGMPEAQPRAPSCPRSLMDMMQDLKRRQAQSTDMASLDQPRQSVQPFSFPAGMQSEPQSITTTQVSRFPRFTTPPPTKVPTAQRTVDPNTGSPIKPIGEYCDLIQQALLYGVRSVGAPSAEIIAKLRVNDTKRRKARRGKGDDGRDGDVGDDGSNR
ncbi:hypothetical protein EJ03DRAFT_384372 [Teratosphaeria nubilosa]|uniref:Uncharacterized protein n=1 Tax=Teratosphaeria nubilosa TaxID=161662 RepID=A0A6G1L3A2_9PEZI|nr:hypothetical protein EJ03DRAFT_384372 [Teratosphaeria nubilosa]